jgi:hypothetical protein
LAPAPQQGPGEADEKATKDRHQQHPGWAQIDVAQIPGSGDPEGEPPQPGEEQVDQDHTDTCRPPRTQREYQQEQVAVAQPRVGAAGIGCCGAGLFYPLVTCYLGDLAGCGKSPHLEKMVTKSARSAKCTPYKSMGYRGTKTAGLHQKHRSATFSATC